MKDGGNWIGYNPEELENNYNKMCIKIQNFMKYISNTHCNGLLIFIAEHWASPEAVEYSEKLADRLRQFVNLSLKELLDIVIKIRSAGYSWADSTGASINLPDNSYLLLPNIFRIDSKTQSSINGIVGIDYNAFIEEQHYGVLVNADDTRNLAGEIKQLASNLGFVGAGQIEAIENAVYHIHDDICNLIRRIIDECVAEGKNIAQKYQDTAGRISKEFEMINTIETGLY